MNRLKCALLQVQRLPDIQTIVSRFIQHRKYSPTKPICHKIKRLIKPRSTSIQPNRRLCGIRCDCKTQKKHAYSTEGKGTGCCANRKNENHKKTCVLPEIVAWQSSISKAALLVQLCMSWCATLVPELEEWFPVERIFTIDRQGRANRISIGGWLLGNVRNEGCSGHLSYSILYYKHLQSYGLFFSRFYFLSG